jgi:hypothetical protein
MDKIVAVLVYYVAGAMTGFPALLFVAYAIGSLLRGTWRWDRRRKLLLINVFIYPLVLACLFLLLWNVFGIGPEARSTVQEIEKAQEEAIRRGEPPARNNAFLGTLFVGAFYFGSTLVPTVLLGLFWTVASSLLLIRSGPGVGSAVRAHVLAVTVTLACVAIAYVLRTLFFNRLLP